MLGRGLMYGMYSHGTVRCGSKTLEGRDSETLISSDEKRRSTGVQGIPENGWDLRYRR